MSFVYLLSLLVLVGSSKPAVRRNTHGSIAADIGSDGALSFSTPAGQKDAVVTAAGSYTATSFQCTASGARLTKGTGDGSMWRCNGGFCIEARGRCNGVKNCFDNSDEANCPQPSLLSGSCNDSAMIMPACATTHQEFATALVTKMQKRILPKRALDHVLESVTKSDMVGAEKLWMEFGVFKGDSSRRIKDRLAELENTHGAKGGMLFGFDSFEGLPELWNKGYTGYTGYEAGSFKFEAEPFQDPHVTWVKGWFNESMPPFLQGHAGQVVFAHLDADLYSSTASVLQSLAKAKRIAPGCVLVFDDLLNFPAYRDGELKALWEFFKETGRPIEVIGASGPQVYMDPDWQPNDQKVAEAGAVRVM